MILVKKIGFALLWVVAVLTVFVACIPIGCRMSVDKLRQKLLKRAT